jgi:hypothetical protein
MLARSVARELQVALDEGTEVWRAIGSGCRPLFPENLLLENEKGAPMANLFPKPEGRPKFLRASSVNLIYPALTPELSRTDLRHGVMVHVTI